MGGNPCLRCGGLLGFWLFGTAAFYGAWQAEAFKPNNASVLRAPEWVGCSVNPPPDASRRDSSTAAQLGCFLTQPEAEGFPTFNAGVYAFDVLIPVVKVEQQVHWVPDEDIWPIGWFAKGLVYYEILLGWVFSLVAGAALSGIFKSD